MEFDHHNSGLTAQTTGEDFSISSSAREHQC